MALPFLPALQTFLGTAGGGALAGAALPYAPQALRGLYNNLLRPAGNFLESNVLNPMLGKMYPDRPDLSRFTGLPEWLSPEQVSQQQFESSPERQLQKQLLNEYSNPQNRPSFDPIRQKYLDQFRNMTEPSIRNRYAGLGIADSSAARNALTNASSSLAKELAAMEAEWQRGGESNDLNRLSNLGSYLTGQQQLGLASQQAQASQQQGLQELALKQLGLGQQKSQSDLENMLKVLIANQERIKSGQLGAQEQAKIALKQNKQPIVSEGQSGILAPSIKLLIKGLSNPWGMVKGRDRQ